MTEKKNLERDEKEESARFIETAERIQDEHAEERFEEAMKKIARRSTTHGQESE